MTRWALSTVWHESRVSEPSELLGLPGRIGFGGIELSSVDARCVEALVALGRDGLPPVVSLHAPCPVPYPGGARADYLASAEEAQRVAAVDHTRRTIDAAEALGAGAVVVHLGTIDLPVPQSAILGAMEDGDPGWSGMLEEGLRDRRGLSARHLDRCMRSLEALAEHAAGSGVRIAPETRYEYNDIPDLEEFRTVLDAFGPRGVGYWHDVGHAHAQSVLGLAPPGAYLERFRDHLVGFHVHDAVGARDHYPPGEGEIGLAELRSYIEPHHICVVEVAARHTSDRVAASLGYLEGLGL